MTKYQTEQRKKLVSFFKEKCHQTFSALDVYEQLKSENISKSSVYRNLAMMEQEGILHKVSEKNRKEVLFQYAKLDSCQDVIHLKCETCHEVLHFDKHLSKMITNIARDNHFFNVNNHLMLYGECETCSQNH